MALVQCRECSQEVSTSAKTCPGCGSPAPKSIGVPGYIGVLVVGILAYKGCSPDAAPPSFTSEQVAAKALQQTRYDRTVLVMASIKRAMREPDSISWITAHANDDASVVCLSYRARNGFGGMNVEYAVGTPHGISTSDDSWDKNCAGRGLHDTISAKRGVP